MQETTKKITICIPVYNRADLIESSVNSALAQTYSNFEIIVVDNASDDGTWELLQQKYNSEPKVKLYRNNNNLGPVKNWLKCISLSDGHFTKILFSDDSIAENYLSECIKMFDENIAFVITPAQVGPHQKHAKVYYSQNNQIINKSFFRSYLVSYPNALVSPGAALFRTEDLRRSFVEALPDYESVGFSYYGAGPDLLLFLQTLERYDFVAYSPLTSAFFRSHDGSATTSAIKSRSWPIRECYNKTRAWHLTHHGSERDRNKLAGRILITEFVEEAQFKSSKAIKEKYYGLEHNYFKAFYYAIIFAIKSFYLRRKNS
ncbi:glycosyltransferase [Paracoccaceae bacterium]|nr:glycosyltransferase [Paracoccaceae bacterium]